MPYLLGDFANGADFWAVSQAIPAFPQKLTWGYSGHLPKSAPKTAQNSRLMSKSGPFSCRTVQDSRVAARTGQPSPKPPRTPGPRRMPHNRKPANKTRPTPRGSAGLVSSRFIAKSSAASRRPHAVEPCAPGRPAALTPRSRCGVGARRPGRRRSHRPRSSR